MFHRFTPDTLNWHREGKGVWVSNDGLARATKEGNVWRPSVRPDLDAPWRESRYVYGALHAGQSACRGMQAGNHE